MRLSRNSGSEFVDHVERRLAVSESLTKIASKTSENKDLDGLAVIAMAIEEAYKPRGLFPSEEEAEEIVTAAMAKGVKIAAGPAAAPAAGAGAQQQNWLQRMMGGAGKAMALPGQAAKGVGNWWQQNVSNPYAQGRGTAQPQQAQQAQPAQPAAQQPTGQEVDQDTQRDMVRMSELMSQALSGSIEASNEITRIADELKQKAAAGQTAYQEDRRMEAAGTPTAANQATNPQAADPQAGAAANPQAATQQATQ